MGGRGIRFLFVVSVAGALLAASAVPAMAAKGGNANVTYTACIATTGEFVETVTWSHVRADEIDWFMDGGSNGSGGFSVPFAKATNRDTLQQVGPAGPVWNVQALAVTASLVLRGRTVWTERLDEPVGGWPTCP